MCRHHPERSSGRSTHLAPPPRTWRCNDRKGEARAAPSLPRAGDEQGGDRPGSGGQSPYRVPLDRDRSTGPGVGRRACRVRSEMSDAVEAGSVQAVDRHASQGVPEAHGCTALQRGPGRWLPGQLQPSEALCTQGPASTPRGAGRALRDGAWASGPGGLRPLPATVGQALRTNRRAGLLEAAVGSVLHPADHEGPDAWPGVFVFLLRRRAPQSFCSTQ